MFGHPPAFDKSMGRLARIEKWCMGAILPRNIDGVRPFCLELQVGSMGKKELRHGSYTLAGRYVKGSLTCPKALIGPVWHLFVLRS